MARNLSNAAALMRCAGLCQLAKRLDTSYYRLARFVS